MELNPDKAKFEMIREQIPQFLISDGWLYIDFETARHHPLFGTSGWTAFFRLILYVSPVVGILAGIEKFSILNGQYTNLILFSFFIDFSLLFLSWLLASELANPEPKSLSYVFVYLICAFTLFFITATIVINMYYGVNPKVDTLLNLHLARDAFLLTILSFYFTLSKRVNITYRHRTKVGSAFAKSLELTLFKASSKKLRIQKNYIDNPQLEIEAEDLIDSEEIEDNKELEDNEELEIVPIKSIHEASTTQTKEQNASDSFFSRLFALKKVLDEGLITKVDYEEKKKLILNDL